MERYNFTSFDGKKIVVTEWKPEGEIRGLVQISHGMVEHSLRYSELAARLNALGFLVFADDHRAHGETDKNTLGWCAGDIFHDTLRDLGLLTERYKSLYPELKLVFFGHSYGSFLAQAYIQNYRGYDGAVLGGSAKMSGAMSLGGKIVSSLGCAFRGGKAEGKAMYHMTFASYNKKFKTGNFVTSVPHEAARYEKDPLCSFICSYHFYKCFMGGLRKLYTKKGLENIDRKKPMLVLSGEKDPVGGFGRDTKKLYEMYQKIGVKDLSLELLPNTRHEYFNDAEKERAYENFLGFVSRFAR